MIRAKTGHMKRPRGHRGSFGTKGFSLIEMMFVLVIAGVLIGFGIPRVKDAYHRRDVQAARDEVIFMGARARSNAVEKSARTDLFVDVTNGRAYVVEGTDTIDRVDVNDELGVAVSAPKTSYQVCYTARGYADASCGTVTDTALIEFSRAGHTAGLVIWRLGQMTKQ